MANPFSEVSYEKILELHKEEKSKCQKQLRELSSILISTLKNSEEQNGISNIFKYFTQKFLENIRDYYSENIKTEKIELDTNQEMLDYARNKPQT